MARQENMNSSLDFIFRTPKKLLFSRLYRYYFDFILRLLYRVIVFDNVPETVSETFFKLILYTQGKICFFRGNFIGESSKDLLALNCSRADTPDVYYIPRKVLVTNPRLKKSYMIEPGKDCEIVYLSEADKYNLSEINGGLYSLIERTATMLSDNDISINIAQKNTRLTNIISGDTQNTVDSIRAVIMSMYEGDPTIVVKSSLIDKLQGVPILNNTANSHNLIELIEVQQYILSHFYEQIGIQTHDQMKRERLITAEINDNLDLCFLNVDDMLVTIQEGLKRVNEMFGTEITAKLNPIIERQREEAAAMAAAEDPPADNADEDPPAEMEPDPADDKEPEPASSPGEDPENDQDEPEDQSDDQEEEAAAEPEQEPGQEEEAAPDDQDEDEDQSDDQEEEAAPSDPDDDAAEDLAKIGDISIEGDNNVIIIQGGDDVGSTDEDELSDVGHDNENGDDA